MPEVEAPLSSGSGRVRARRAVRRRRWPWITLAAVLLIVVGVGVWLGIKVLTVKSELEAAQASVAAVQGGGDTKQAIHSIATHAAVAAAAANDPVWRASEALPFAGDNLRAVRLASESLDALSGGLGAPILDAFGKSGDGPVLARVVPMMRLAAPRVTELSASVSAVRNSTSLVPQVRAGVDQVAQVLAVAAPALELMPRMLGADAPKNYLLVAQNNAESVGLGGSAASQSLIRIDAGTIKITAQADSGDYQGDLKVNVPIDQSALDLYHDVMLRRINASVSRPDFPTAARVMTAMWQRDIHNDQIDGVISIDPIALSHVLGATGPITVASGDSATSENIVRLLLSEAYARSADPAKSDQFFKEVATSVFNKVANGQFDPKKMLSAVQTGINGGSILFWSADPEIQQRVSTMSVGGVLPADNVAQTLLGVYFRDASRGSKIDYYMKSAVAASAACSGSSTFTATVTLHLDLTQQAADALPAYVKSQVWGSKKFSTEVFIYGPPGTTVSNVKLGADTAKLRSSELVDLGRPVASFTTFQRPGQSVTVTATFTAAAGAFGPLKVQTTPMVQATKVTLAGQPCAGK
ncbi:MAG TPA: DUF4012 domain-containing protein [Propionicimonas sp.]